MHPVDQGSQLCFIVDWLGSTEALEEQARR
jgi:hypothetical protein